MILGVNGIRLVKARSGVARVTEALLRCLDELAHPFDEVRVYSPTSLPDDVFLPAMAHNVVVESSFGSALWEQFALPRAHGNAGLLLCPSYVVPIFSRSPTFLIHHGSYEGQPQGFTRWQINKARFAYAASAHRASMVSTVSKHSRETMCRYYGMDRDRIAVIPNGVDTKIFRPVSDGAHVDAFRMSVTRNDKPYIVYVGKPTERRNITALLHAFARLKRERGLPHMFVLVGAGLPGTSPIRDVIRALSLQDDVILIEHAAYDQMPLIYNAASLLAFPSSGEGFGMPVLEAMACGTPVLTLDSGAMPEFSAGVAELLPDASVETLMKGITRILDDGLARTRMLIDGPARAAAYDWHIIAQRYLDLMIPIAERAR